MSRTVPVIGLAGGIGSGKSEVGRILADLGCVVSDSDAVARAALDEPDIRDRIVERFGKYVLDSQGQVDRSALAAIVFPPTGEAEHRKVLESIIHPYVERKRLEQLRAAPADIPAFVIDAPLLFEAGLNRICNAVIFVDAPLEERLKRVKEHRDWDAEELARREVSQMPLDEKRSRADYVVSNLGSLEELAKQVRRVLATILETRKANEAFND